jgi:sugar-specific transcriptional regulator TrmB
MIQEKEIQILVDLGLTSVQAKVYLTLINLGSTTVKIISKASSIVSQDIYRIMPQLQKLGLAEKILTKPTRYRATPLNDGLHILLQKRTEEQAELQKKALWLFNTFQEKDPRNVLQEEESHLNIIAEKKLLYKNLKNQSRMAQKCIDICAPIQGCNILLFNLHRDLTKAMERGVKIRVLAENFDETAVLRVAHALKENQLFEMKYFFPTFPSGISIFDDQEVTMAIGERGLPSLRTANPGVVKLAISYFNEMWRKSHQNQVKDTQKEICKVQTERL